MNPFRRPGAEESQYGPPPAMRREEIQALAARARKLPPTEQMQMAADFTLRMQNEVDPLVRADVVRALGSLSTENSREALRMAMGDGETSVRIAATQAWREMGGPEAAAALSEILASDTDLDVRLAATRALGAIDDPAAVRGLAVALDDGNPALQRRAMESLKTASGQDLGYDVVAWRNYVEGGSIAAPRRGPTFVERLRDRF